MIQEAIVNGTGVRWKEWPTTGEGEGDCTNLMWEVHGPTNLSTRRLAQRVKREIPASVIGRIRETGDSHGGWMILGIHQGTIEEIERAVGWLERVKEVLEGDVGE